MLDIKELGVILINCYRLPSTPIQLFEETLAKCQEAIDDLIEKEVKSKILLCLGDFNFPFIEWPRGRMYSREHEPDQRASEKVEGRMLLDWAEANFMEQYITTPTRKGNILDLVFTKTLNLISEYSTIVNKSFSDHNTIKINMNIKDNNDEKKSRRNPYPNKIYEYELLNAKEEDWIRYNVLLTKLSENFDDDSEHENTEEKLTRFYNLLEQAVTTLFEKKDSFKIEDEKKHKPGNKIPKRMRILMRKKTSISKKMMASSLSAKTLRLMKLLETIEMDLRTRYKNMKIKKQNEALSKIKKNPKYF